MQFKKIVETIGGALLLAIIALSPIFILRPILFIPIFHKSVHAYLYTGVVLVLLAITGFARRKNPKITDNRYFTAFQIGLTFAFFAGAADMSEYGSETSDLYFFVAGLLVVLFALGFTRVIDLIGQ